MSSFKRKADDELVSPPPKRHQATSLSPPNRLTRLAKSPRSSRSISSQQSTRSSSNRSLFTSPSASVPASPVDHEAEEDPDDLLCRIQEGIEYEQKQRNMGASITQTTRFEVSTTSSPALDLLRRYATLIWASDTHEVHELGIPKPDWVAEGVFPGIHDPQWWVDKSLAEIKAGPHGEESDIKRATATLKGLETKRNKKKEMKAREKEIDWKLEEGLRQQKRGLSMCDDDSTEDVSESDGGELNGSKVSESDNSEDQMPIKRGVRQVAAKAPRSHKRPLESDSEDERPPRHVVKRMTMTAPKRRARPVINDSESDSESEDDVPILKDPRYLNFKRQRTMRG